MNDSELTSSLPLEMHTHNICYLSAPYHVNLKTLREHLAAKGTKSITSSELPTTRQRILGSAPLEAEVEEAAGDDEEKLSLDSF